MKNTLLTVNFAVLSIEHRALTARPARCFISSSFVDIFKGGHLGPGVLIRWRRGGSCGSFFMVYYVREQSDSISKAVGVLVDGRTMLRGMNLLAFAEYVDVK